MGDQQPTPAPRLAGKVNTGTGAHKAALQQRTSHLKGQIAIASIVGFAVLAGLVATHRVGTGASGASATAAPSTAASPGFFDQGSTGGQGFGLGQGLSGINPFGGSGVS
jgi:hypothetical protein